MIISFETLKSICNHGGYIKDGYPMCDFKDKRKAKCWAEWQKCNAVNCPFNLKNEYPEKYEQYTFDLEETLEGIQNGNMGKEHKDG